MNLLSDLYEDVILESARRAGFDLDLIDTNLALTVEQRWRQHDGAVALLLDLEQARIERDARLRSTPSTPR